LADFFEPEVSDHVALAVFDKHIAN
jgi:hypothetical protein